MKTLENHRTKKEHAQLRENIEQNYLDTLEVLISVIEAKDSYTRGHFERVSKNALAIAKEMKLSSGETERIRAAGLLHDIGKIAIDIAILLKNGPLTDEERKDVQTYCECGVKILKPATFLGRILPIVHQHHERFDGKGYPQGLKGDKIDPGARILAVADSFDMKMFYGDLKEENINLLFRLDDRGILTHCLPEDKLKGEAGRSIHESSVHRRQSGPREVWQAGA